MGGKRSKTPEVWALASVVALLCGFCGSGPCASDLICAPLQVERKRHIGNDIVTIVFQEGEEPSPAFKPSMIRSHFTRILGLGDCASPGSELSGSPTGLARTGTARCAPPASAVTDSRGVIARCGSVSDAPLGAFSSPRVPLLPPSSGVVDAFIPRRFATAALCPFSSGVCEVRETSSHPSVRTPLEEFSLNPLRNSRGKKVKMPK